MPVAANRSIDEVTLIHSMNRFFYIACLLVTPAEEAVAQSNPAGLSLAPHRIVYEISLSDEKGGEVLSLRLWFPCLVAWFMN